MKVPSYDNSFQIQGRFFRKKMIYEWNYSNVVQILQDNAGAVSQAKCGQRGQKPLLPLAQRTCLKTISL